MMSGYGMRSGPVRFSKPQCPVCNRIFSTPQGLVTHFNTFHSNHHLSTYSSAVAAAAVAARTTFHHYPTLNRNPNPVVYRNPNPVVNRNPNPVVNRNPSSVVFPARNSFDLTYYQRGYLDTQGRFLKGVPPARSPVPAMTPAKRSNVLFEQQNKKPRLVEFFQATENGGYGLTLPLISQLEHQIPVETVTENGGAISSSIDLALRL